MVAQLIGRALLTQETLLFAVVRQVLPMLDGAYALAIVDREAPDTVVLARQGSPLVLVWALASTSPARTLWLCDQ